MPIDRPVRNTAFLGKLDWTLTPSNKLALSYNFDHSKNTNQTFDVATYGNSANGTEGPSKIQVLNFNLFSAVTPTMVNEAHFTYGRESRPRSAAESNIPADTAMGFATTFRFGNPFFLQPERRRAVLAHAPARHLLHRQGRAHRQVRRRVAAQPQLAGLPRLLHRAATSSTRVTGFLRYASPAALGGGFGPSTVGCSNGALRHGARDLPRRHDGDRRPAPPLPAGRRAHRPGDRRRGLLRHQATKTSRSSRRTPGRCAPTSPQLRPALGGANLPRPRRAARRDGLRHLPQRPALPFGRHAPEPEEDVPAARRLRVGHRRAAASPSCAPATASTSRARTCSRRSARSRPTASSSRPSS